MGFVLMWHVCSDSFTLYATIVSAEVVKPVLPGFTVCPGYLPYKKKAGCVVKTA